MLTFRGFIATIALSGLVVSVLIANLPYPPEPTIPLRFEAEIFYPLVRIVPVGEELDEEPPEERWVHDELAPKIREAGALTFKERFSP